MMPEEFNSSLGFEATEALKTLRLLDTLVTAYSTALKDNASITRLFNTEQGKSDNILEQFAAATKAARAEVERLSAAEKEAAAAIKKTADANKAAQDLERKRVALGVRRTVEAAAGPNFRQSASNAEIVNFDKSLDQLEKLAKRTKVSQGQVNRILGNLRGSYRGAEREIRDAIVKILANSNKLGKVNFTATARALKKLGQDANTSGQQVSKGLQQATASSQSFLLTWQGISRFFVGQSIFRGISAVTSQVTDSISRARELQIALAAIQTIAPAALRATDTADLGAFTTDISNTFGIDQLEVAKATYEAFSNQVGDTAETLGFLREAAVFAKGAVTSLNNAQALGSGIINAYGLEASSATDVFDKLFKTFDLGRVTADEIADSFGRSAPLAAQLGVSLDELLAGLATLTIQGLSADESLTRLNNIFIRLIKPAGDLQIALDKLGVTSIQAFIQTEGLVPALELIKSTTDGTIEELGKLLPNIRGFSGAVTLAAQNGKLYADTLKEIQENSAGASEEAFKLINATPAAELQRSIETAKNVFANDFGVPAISALNKIIELFGGAEVAATLLTTALIGGVAAASVLIGGQLVVAIGGATAALVGMGAAATTALGVLTGLALFTGFGLATAAVIALTLAFKENRISVEEYRQAIIETNKESEKAAKEQIQSAKDVAAAVQAATRNNATANLRALQAHNRATSEERNAALAFQKSVTDDLKDQVKSRERLITRFIDNVRQSITDADTEIKKLKNDTVDIEFRVNKDRFDRNLNAASPSRQAALLQSRVAELLRAQSRASQAGNKDFATSLNDEALSVASKLADIEGRRRSGEAQVNKVLAARKALNNSLVSQQEQLKSQALASEVSLNAQQQELGALFTRYTDISKELNKAESSDSERLKLAEQLFNVAGKIQEKLTSFSGPDTQGINKELDKQLKQIREGFTNLSGQKVDLQFAVGDAIIAVENELAKTRFSAEIELKISNLTGIAVGPDLTNQLQARIGELQKEASTFETANAAAIDSQKKLDAALANTVLGFETLRKEAFDAGQTFSNVLGVTTGAVGLPDFGAKERLQTIKQYRAALLDLQNQVSAAVKAGDAEALGQVDKQLVNIQTALETVPNAGATLDVVKTLRTQLEQIVASQGALIQNKGTLAIAEQAQATLAALNSVIPTADLELQKLVEVNAAAANMAPAMQTGATGANAALESVIQQQRRAIETQRQLNSLMQIQGQGGGPVQGRASGGPIHYFANGGFAPRGTDTVPAMLSPKEFIVNAESAQRFAPELVAINSGRPPVYRENGGVVNNTFTGDININPGKGSTAETGRATVAAIKRELRRKSSGF